MIETDDLFKLTEAMLTYGGSFAKCIAKALQVADAENTHKLLTTFGDLIESYRRFLK